MILATDLTDFNPLNPFNPWLNKSGLCEAWNELHCVLVINLVDLGLIELPAIDQTLNHFTCIAVGVIGSENHLVDAHDFLGRVHRGRIKGRCGVVIESSE